MLSVGSEDQEKGEIYNRGRKMAKKGDENNEGIILWCDASDQFISEDVLVAF